MPTAAAAVTADAEVSVAAIGICFGLHVIVFMLVDGLAVAVSVRVANELGEQLPGCSCVVANRALCGLCLQLCSTDHCCPMVVTSLAAVWPLLLPVNGLGSAWH
jgi:hypothetical protein